MTIAYIALGSNLGNRRRNLLSALQFIDQLPSTKVKKIASFISTKPVGGPPQGRYLNTVIKILTELDKHTLLTKLLDIEIALGRRRRVRWGPRTLDLDLLTYGNAVYQGKKLTIPHPRYHTRFFVLKPLSEIAPRHIHPLLRKTSRTLLKLHHESNYHRTDKKF